MTVSLGTSAQATALTIFAPAGKSVSQPQKSGELLPQGPQMPEGGIVTKGPYRPLRYRPFQLWIQPYTLLH
jgi:hypothetical protein